jgi:iron complex transport system ATP-binding protein
MAAYSLQNVSFQYREKAKIINRLTIEISENQIVVLLGANGVGKSTFLKLCLGFLEPNTGQILLNGQNLNAQPPSVIGKAIAYTPQSPEYPFQLSVEDYILLGRTPHLRSFQSPKEVDRNIAADILTLLEIDLSCQTNITGN